MELVGHGDVVPSIAFTASGDTIATAGYEDSSVRLWDVTTPEAPIILPHEDATVASVAFSPDGEWLATGSASGLGSELNNAVRLWKRGQWDAPVFVKRSYGSAVRALAFNADGTQLATAAEFDQEVVVWLVGGGTA